MANAITRPSLQINGIYIGIVPNSLTSIRGAGTVEVKAQSFGSTVRPVFEPNQEMAIGHITFMIYPITDDIDQIRAFQDAGSTLTVIYTDPDSGEQRTMVPASITNDPNYELGADKTITVEVKGAQIV